MELLPAIVLGALISAFIGVLSAYLSERFREQEWKRENIYRPLYNEVNSLTSARWLDLGELFTGWMAVDGYSKLRVERKLREEFNAYEALILRYNQMKKQLEEVMHSYLRELEDIVRRVLPPQFISKDGESILLEKNASIKIKTWVSMFGEQLLDSKSSKELEQNLVKHSEARGWGHEKYLKKWVSEKPEIFDRLMEERFKLNADYEKAYRKLKGKRSEIITLANRLKYDLEKRIRKKL